MNPIRASLFRSCLAVAWLAVCCLQPAAAAVSLPTEAFARLPQIANASLSPSGEWLAALMNRGDHTLLVVRRVDGHEAPKVILRSDNSEFSFSWVQWASDERLVLSLRFAGVRNAVTSVETRLLALDRDGGHQQTLVDPSSAGAASRAVQVQDRVIDWLPGDGKHILIEAPASPFDLSPLIYRVDLATGMREAVQYRRPGVRHWLTDGTHRARVGVKQEGTKMEVLVCDPDGSHWRTAWAYDLFSRDAVSPMGFGRDPNLLYVRGEGGGRHGVFVVDLRDPALERRLVLERDPGGRLIVDASGEAVGVLSPRDGEASAAFWEPKAQALARAIDAGLPGRFNRLIQFSADGARYLLYSSGNGVPGQFLIGHRERNQLDVLGRQYPELPPQALARKRPFLITARDGLRLPALLTLPPGVPETHLPTVVLPHGGPIDSDGLDFDPLAAFLADRGYAVLQVNFRGSGGLGFDHMNAGLRRWGLEMQDDLTDSLDWLVKRGVADPARVCIVGGSYGGYAALMGGARTPELYRCVVSLAGASDLLTMATYAEKFVNGEEVFGRQVGAAWGDRQQLKDTSPRRLAAQFRAPVLLIHGRADTVVPIEQSELMAAALKDAGKPVQLVTLETGDHQLRRRAPRLQFYRELEGFLALHLGAPAESASVPASAAR